jgi:hypothetical protein
MVMAMVTDMDTIMDMDMVMDMIMLQTTTKRLYLQSFSKKKVNKEI